MGQRICSCLHLLVTLRHIKPPSLTRYFLRSQPLESVSWEDVPWLSFAFQSNKVTGAGFMSDLFYISTFSLTIKQPLWLLSCWTSGATGVRFADLRFFGSEIRTYLGTNFEASLEARTLKTTVLISSTANFEKDPANGWLEIFSSVSGSKSAVRAKINDFLWCWEWAEWGMLESFD